MDNLKIDGNILAKNFCINGGAFDFITGRPVQSKQILSMIEQRIRDEVEPKVLQTEKDLMAIISIELNKLGIKPSMTSTHQYVSSIVDKYREGLVGERITAIVDGLVSEKPVVMGVDMASGSDASIITLIMPPDLTQDQRDRIAADIKSQLPSDTSVVTLPHGVELNRA